MVAIVWGCLGHFRLSLSFRLHRNILGKVCKLYFCVRAGVHGCVCVRGGVHARYE